MLLRKLLFGFCIVISANALGGVNLLVKEDIAIQTDSWSCGLQSATRVLQTYGRNVEYAQLRGDIGPSSVNIDFTTSIATKVCNSVGGTVGAVLTPICNTVLKPVTEAISIPLPMGRSARAYADRLKAFDADFRHEEGVNEQRIKALLDQGIPVIVLHMVNIQKISQKVAGVGVGLDFPKLHYYVVSGYNDEGYHIYDTYTTERIFESREEFRKKFEWEGWNGKSLTHAALRDQAGVHPRSIMYINRSINRNNALSITSGDKLDFDGDGKGDVFSVRNGNFYYNSAGRSAYIELSPSRGYTIDKVRFGDFNGDRITDILVADSKGDWYVAMSGRNWQLINQGGGSIDQIRIGDFNGDDVSDVFMLRSSDSSWLISYAGREKLRAVNSDKTQTLQQLKFADFDNDGKTDVFSIHTNGSWQYSSSATGSYRSLGNSDSGLNVLATKLADINGDGRADVLTVKSGKWMVSYSGTSPYQTINSDASKTLQQLLLTDMNGNGTFDVFTVTDGIWKLSANGSGGYENINSDATSSVEKIRVSN